MDRKVQNRALRDWVELSKTIGDLDGLVRQVLLRATGDTLSHPPRDAPNDPMRGSQTTHYADPTGEAALREEFLDFVSRNANAIVRNVSLALNAAKEIANVTPHSIAERAKRSTPDCLACGKPVVGRVRSGYGQDCYQAWRRDGFPERSKFERARRLQIDEVVTESGKDFSYENIVTLQERGELPSSQAKNT